MASSRVEQCPIWPDYPGIGQWLWSRDALRMECSPRTGGEYEITREALLYTNTLSGVKKAILTTALIDKRSNNECPLVTSEMVKAAQISNCLSIDARCDRLLSYLENSTTVGGIIKVYGPLPPSDRKEMNEAQIAGCEALAWSESLTLDELQYFLDDLSSKGLIEHLGTGGYRVTVDGRRSIENQVTSVHSMQAFVAM